MEQKNKIAIIGAGVAGVTAAVYAARAGFAPAVYEPGMIGGQIASAAEVGNFPAFTEITGAQLAVRMGEQLAHNGIEPIRARVSAARAADSGFALTTDVGEFYHDAMIIANGGVRRKLGCPGEAEFVGRGVSYCATCDGGFFHGKRVAIVGGGNSAAEEALYLANLCERVYLIHRRALTALPALEWRIKEKDNIELLIPHTVRQICGDTQVRSLVLDGGTSLDIDGVFIAIGMIPDNAAFADLVDLEDGYIHVDERMRTRTPGVYAAGDTRARALRQLVTAAADGALAAGSAADYLRGQR